MASAIFSVVKNIRLLCRILVLFIFRIPPPARAATFIPFAVSIRLGYARRRALTDKLSGVTARYVAPEARVTPVNSTKFMPPLLTVGPTPHVNILLSVKANLLVCSSDGEGEEISEVGGGEGEGGRER